MTQSEPAFQILFEPVRIGPVTARNRFIQVPHCNGMGYRDPSALAAMRGTKAEGGWAVVATEEAEIHPSSELTPYIEGRIWDDRDIPGHLMTTGSIHAHGALAAIELVHSGMSAPNQYTRIPPMGPSHRPLTGRYAPIQSRRMTKTDIVDLRRWHREAAVRSIAAGYDIVYVYAGHNLTTIQHFLSRRYNDRSDEYGGSLENRARLLREILEDTVEAVDGRAGVACRIAIDELIGERGFTREEMSDLLGLVGELPDLWDFMVGSWPDDSVTSRFGEENQREDLYRGLKALTSKPVVGVGRFTSPDTMVRLIRQGVLDFIGAARPSIADPFLPNKIREGRIDEIRECIGCNICVSGDNTMSPIRCTQNPSMGEEWRRGWHPERMPAKSSDRKVLVVGAGPAGLEAAMSAGRRGYEVTLIEASRELGGRVARESRLPGLAAWRRVLDYRTGRIDAMANVQYFLESPLTATELLGYGFGHVAVCTGASWRRDGLGYWHNRPIEIDPAMEVLTPDDLLDGRMPTGREVVVFDDDHYYMGGVLAELLVSEGFETKIVTPAADVSNWTHHTMEQERIQARLMDLGVGLVTSSAVSAVGPGGVEITSVYNDRREGLACDSLILVTSRIPNEGPSGDLLALVGSWAEAGLETMRAVGDAFSPGTIASAVWDGRRFAEDLDRLPADGPFPRDMPAVG